MTEIPEKMQKEHNMDVCVKIFLAQLRVALEIKSQLVTLRRSGHFSFQDGYELKVALTEEHKGFTEMRGELKRLKAELQSWNETVRAAREKYYFLNFFTMREILKLIRNVAGESRRLQIDVDEESDARRLENEVAAKLGVDIASPTRAQPKSPSGRGSKPGAAGAAASSSGKADTKDTTYSQAFAKARPAAPGSVATPDGAGSGAPAGRKLTEGELKERQKMDKKFQRAYKENRWRCFNGDCFLMNRFHDPKCNSCGRPRPKWLTDQIEERGIKPQRKRVSRSPSQGRAAFGDVSQFVSLLQLVDPSMDATRVKWVHRKWRTTIKKGTADAAKGDTATRAKQNKFQMESLGAMLTELLQPKADESKTSGDAKTDGKSDEESIKSGPRGQTSRVRALPLPGKNAANVSDMLQRVESTSSVAADGKQSGGGDGQAPIWAACADSPADVIDLVLSVYVRRGRLPEPGEILFCDAETTLEDIELLLYRFLRARPYGKGHYIFCIANLHNLDYTMQVSVLSKLRELVARYQTAEAASLLFLSGKARQVILNALSANVTALSPLDRDTLRRAVAEAASRHCGETLAVLSDINGGGKTDFILRNVAKRQQKSRNLRYRRVPYQESSTAGTLVRKLSRFTGPRAQNAVHLDIGHIIPANANTCLFELLVLGVLKDPVTLSVYARSKRDIFFIEIPNSTGDRTSQALRICQLLPFSRVTVDGKSLVLNRPVFTDAPMNTRLGLPASVPDDALVYVTNFLKAFKEKKFENGPKCDMKWTPRNQKELDPAEVFEILKDYGTNDDQPDDRPSFSSINNFVQYMREAFKGMDPEVGYELTKPMLIQFAEGLEEMRHSVCDMLIATSKTFAKRSVPRDQQFSKASDNVKEKNIKTKGRRVRSFSCFLDFYTFFT